MALLSDHGPHGGHLFDMPENSKFEFEFTQDSERRRIVIYANAARSNQPFALPTHHLKGRLTSGRVAFDVSIKADPRETDPTGESSRFALSFNSIPQQLLESNEFVVKVCVK